MAELRRVRLGREAVEYVQDRLAPGGGPEYPLREALSQLPLLEGRFWTWAPSGVQIRRSDIEGGFPSGLYLRGARDPAASFISQFLARGDRLALLEAFLASPSDPWLAREQVPDARLAGGDRLYWYATQPVMVAPMLECGYDHFCCAALGQLDESLTVGPTVTTEQVRDFGSRAAHFLVDAFDACGYVVWSRS